VPEDPARPARPPGTLRVGTIAGSDVLISSSWFLVAGLIAILVAPVAEVAQLPQVRQQAAERLELIKAELRTVLGL